MSYDKQSLLYYGFEYNSVERRKKKKVVSKQKCIDYIYIYIYSWNLGNSNANFSKLTDFLKTTDGPDFFHYNLLQKYHRFFEFQFFEKINFSNRFVGPNQRNSYENPLLNLKFQTANQGHA